MQKLFWLALPLVLFTAIVGAQALRGRLPSRQALNVLTSLLLLGYLATTAGLGIFWVANQQLPVFDWHYLFGYFTLLLVAVHLVFNARIVFGFFTRRAGPRRGEALEPSFPSGRSVGYGAGLLLLAGAAFFLGMRHGKTTLRVEQGAASGPGGGYGGPVHVVEQYHAFSSHSPAGVVSRAPSVDWGVTPPPFKRYPGRPITRLPKAAASMDRGRSISEALVGQAAARTEPLSLEALSAILFHTAGITDDRGGLALRSSPSSGALFATELYVAARQVQGLAPGLYHYDPQSDALTLLREGELAAADLGAAGNPMVHAAPATVVFTAILRRTGHKYRDRAYRYVLADAGHALENLRVAASELGWTAWPAGAFDDGRAEATLGVDGQEEPVLVIVPLADADAPQRPASVALEYERIPDDPEPLGVTGLVHRATALRDRDDAAAATNPAAGRIALPAATAAQGSALDAIRTRRSRRVFTPEALPLADLSGILGEATRRVLLSGAVRIHVVAHRVAEIEPGAYRYDPVTHSLVRSRAGDLRSESQEAAISQDVIGGAAAVVVLALDRHRMFSETGARGYRLAFLEAGTIGERIYLGAAGRGLGACAVGGFFDAEAAALIGADSGREWVVHFAALGKPR